MVHAFTNAYKKLGGVISFIQRSTFNNSLSACQSAKIFNIKYAKYKEWNTYIWNVKVNAKYDSLKKFIFLRENDPIRDHSCPRIPGDFRESCKENSLVVHSKVYNHQSWQNLK
jgi:hypothetical protein